MDKYTANNSRPKVLYLVSAGCKRFEKTRFASLHYLHIAEVHHQYLTRQPLDRAVHPQPGALAK